MNNDKLELASMRSRAMAFVIDDLLMTIIIMAIYWNQILASGEDLVSILIVMNEFVWQILFLKFIYQTFFVWYYGATIGKIITKIRVVDYNHFGRVSLLSAIFRSGFRLVSEIFFYIGFIFGFLNDGKQTLHDKISKTLVTNA